MPKGMSSRRWLGYGALGVFVAGIFVAAGAGSRQDVTSEYVLPPAAEIIAFDTTVGVLDTTTGAIYRLRGDLRNPSARNTWKMRVGPIKESHSGQLEIQKIALGQHPELTFLVDQVTGRTWILRRRASTNGSWVLVARERSGTAGF